MCPFYNENADEVEGVMSPEEVQELLAKKEEETNKAVEEAQQAMQEEIQTLQQQLEQEREEKRKLEEKGVNFGTLRKKTEEKDSKISELEKKIDELKGAFIGQIDKINQILSDKTIDEAMLKVSGGDRELADKVKFHYKQFAGIPKDEKEMQERINNAMILATGGKSTNIPGSTYSGAGGFNTTNNVVSVNKWTEDQKDLAKKFGITDAEIAKYSGKMPRYSGDGTSNKEWLNR